MLMGALRYYCLGDFLYAPAEARREECWSIISRGFVLQVVCSGLAFGRHRTFPDASTSGFRAEIERHVGTLNQALERIDPDQIQIHVC